MANSTWTTLKYSASKTVADLHKQISNDPFSACFFLSSLYDAKRKEIEAKYPRPIPCPNNVAQKFQELILTEMYIHINRVKINGLRNLEKEI